MNIDYKELPWDFEVLPTGFTFEIASNFEKVREFHQKFNHPIELAPKWPEITLVDLREDLIREEFEELQEAIEDRDIVAVADALTDMLYVIYGMGHVMGINLDACFAEVHRSNMTKLGKDGKPIYREDGKVLKGPNFEKPDLEGVLNVR